MSAEALSFGHPFLGRENTTTYTLIEQISVLQVREGCISCRFMLSKVERWPLSSVRVAHCHVRCSKGHVEGATVLRLPQVWLEVKNLLLARAINV